MIKHHPNRPAVLARFLDAFDDDEIAFAVDTNKILAGRKPEPVFDLAALLGLYESPEIAAAFIHTMDGPRSAGMHLANAFADEKTMVRYSPKIEALADLVAGLVANLTAEQRAAVLAHAGEAA